MTSKDRVIFEQARAIVRREMNQYDALSQVARIKYERSMEQYIDDTHYPTYSCAHGTMLYLPCTKCERTEQDCVVYRNLAVSKLKELFVCLHANDL